MAAPFAIEEVRACLKCKQVVVAALGMQPPSKSKRAHSCQLSSIIASSGANSSETRAHKPAQSQRYGIHSTHLPRSSIV